MRNLIISLMTIFSLSLFNNISPVLSFEPMVKEAYLSRIIKPLPPSCPPPPAVVPAKSFLPFYDLSHHEYINHFSEKANHLNEEIGRNIVLSVSSGLPKFDTVGHKILSANHDFIEKVLHNEILSHQMKKNIILGSIKLAQMGDDMGSHILQQYYDLVERCL
jgi:hypothetical protein